MDPGAFEGLSELLPPPTVLRTMAYAYDVPAALTALLGGDEPDVPDDKTPLASFFRRSFRDKNPEAAIDRFLQAAWMQPQDARTSGGGSDRFKRYQIERLFAKFLHGWIWSRARYSKTLTRQVEQVAWHFGLDMDHLHDPDRESPRLEVHAVRPTIRLRPDGRSKIELLVMLTQRQRYELPSEDDKQQPVLGSDGEPLTFKYRGGCTLIIDPDAGCVRYAISKSPRSEARRARHAAFLREQLQRQGAAAITRFGLNRSGEARQRHQEPFALVHGSDVSEGGY
jgi:hypothetical protein